jgi:hypothetical protein
MDPGQITTLVNSGAGIAALTIVFWMFVKEFPAQRAARAIDAEKVDKMVEKSQVHMETMVREFRAELAIERHECAKERSADRGARHATANALQSVSFSLQLLAQEHPEHAVALKTAMDTVTKDMRTASDANNI